MHLLWETPEQLQCGCGRHNMGSSSKGWVLCEIRHHAGAVGQGPNMSFPPPCMLGSGDWIFCRAGAVRKGGCSPWYHSFLISHQNFCLLCRGEIQATFIWIFLVFCYWYCLTASCWTGSSQSALNCTLSKTGRMLGSNQAENISFWFYFLEWVAECACPG